MEGLKLGKGGFLRRDGARFVHEEAVRRFLLIASFRTEYAKFPCFGFVTSLSNTALKYFVFFHVFQEQPPEHRRQTRQEDRNKKECRRFEKAGKSDKEDWIWRTAQAVQLGYTANFQERAAVCDALATFL